MGQSSGIFPRPDEAESLPLNEKRWDPFTRLDAFFYLTWPGESSMLLYLGDKIDRDIIVAYGCKAFCMSKLHWGKMAPLLCALINSSKQNRLKFASSLNAKDHPITTWCSRLHMFSWFLCPSLNSGELIKDGYTICEQESKKRRPHMLPCFLCVISLQKNVQCGFLFFLYSNLTIGDLFSLSSKLHTKNFTTCLPLIGILWAIFADTRSWYPRTAGNMGTSKLRHMWIGWQHCIINR